MALPVILAPAVYAAATSSTALLSTSWMGAFVAANASAIAATSFAAGASAAVLMTGGFWTALTAFGATSAGSSVLGFFGYTVLPILGIVSTTVATLVTGGLAFAAAGATGGTLYQWKKKKQAKVDKEFRIAIEKKLNEINRSRAQSGLPPFDDADDLIQGLQAYEKAYRGDAHASER